MRCKDCGKVYPEDHFLYNHARICRRCRAIYSRAYYVKNRERRLSLIYIAHKKRVQILKRIVEDYKSSHPCVDCGEKDARVLDFDHVRGRKHMDIVRMVQSGVALSKLQAEISKCEVRCANCHRRRHYEVAAKFF